ncbi:MAG TPA: BBE domain-containing protein, partial [Thermoleophilaceae bacterium]|nr:BBE domain-containing protein [Thermoleophilaceae bacterium]
EEPEGRELLRGVRDLGPAMDTFATVPPVALCELAMDPPEPLPVMMTTAQLDAVPVEELTKAAGPGSGSPLAMIQIRQMGGALERTAPGAGARATLPGAYSLIALGVPENEGLAETIGGYLGAIDRAVEPHRCGEYPNFVERPADASAFFDADTWARLRAVKGTYDPGELFRGNHYIPAA